MAQSLENKIAGVRRRVRCLLLLHALSWVIGVLLACALLLGLIDYWFHLQDRGTRLIFSGLTLAATAWMCYRFLLPALARRFSSVEIAQRIEARFPELRDQLASTVEFLGQSPEETDAGSAQLRRAVIAATEAKVEPLKFRHAVQPKPALRAALLASLLGLVAVALVLLDGASARLAMARLANPLGSAAWPKVNRLVLVDPPTQVALGQSFEVEVRDDNGELPEEVRIHYRYAATDNDRANNSTNNDETIDGFQQQVETMQRVGGRVIARKEIVTRPFEYRAEGGDDDSMPWTRLEVVEPPRIESLELTLRPPPYTGWKESSTDEYIRALVGTLVAMKGTSTKPLRSATLVREHGEPITLTISDDGYSFALSADAERPWIIQRSEKYHFRLHDDGQLPGGVEVQWDIRAIEDHPPGVSIEQPASSIYVTAKATVPLKIVAREDLLVHEMSLHFSRSDRPKEDETEVSLYVRDESAELPQPQSVGNARGDTQSVVHDWDLEPLGLEPGTQISFFATASDYRPQHGQSSLRRITIITPHELENRIAERQSFILGELARVAKMQRDARRKTQDVQTQLDDVGDLRKADVDQLRAGELVQRQVGRSLASPSEGLKSQIDRLLGELKTNRLDSPQIERRMRALREGLTRLARENLPAAERDLTASLKAAQASLADGNKPQAIAGPLRAAGIEQDEIIRTLDVMLGDLTRFDQYRKIYRSVGQMRRDQAEAERRAAELGRGTKQHDFKDATIGKGLDDLTSQQQTDLKKLASGQTELARRFEKTLQEMEGAVSSLGEHDPLAADSVSDAAHLAREKGIAGAMRRAAGQIRRNQVSQSTGAQRDVGRALQDMLDILQNRRESELNRLVKKLREAESQLSDLRKRQKGLRKKMKEAAANPNAEQRKRQLQRLAKEQKQLEDEARRLARQLMRLRAEKTGGQIGRAAGKMSQAGEAGEQGDDAAAQQQADAAQQDLDEAQQQLAKRRRQAEIDLALEQLARLEDALKSLHARQKKLLDDTAQLESQRGDQQRLPRKLAGEVRDLADQQQALYDETAAQAEKLKAAAAFQLVLDGAAGDMQRAAALLNRRRTDQPTQQAQQNALARVARILEALKQEKQAAKKQGDPKDGQPGNNRPAGQIRSLAEVKLIKLMQEDIQRRTTAIEQARAKTDPLAPEQPFTPEQDEEYDQLSREQSQLADLIFNLSRPSEDDPENNPELLPDVGRELERDGELEKDGELLPLDLDLEDK
ncbi:MAG: hypothetical protein IID44_15885 [Planctomycetes bacterium]|nr:hypothetical protein [Planctomycetota bacterium]